MRKFMFLNKEIMLATGDIPEPCEMKFAALSFHNNSENVETNIIDGPINIEK